MVSDRIGFLKPFLSPPPVAAAPEVDRAPERPAAPDLADRRPQGHDPLPPGMIEQIRIVLDQLGRIHEQASQDGAGLPSSRSGEALKGALSGLSSLLSAVRPGAASPEVQSLMQETADTATRVNDSLDRSAEAVSSLLSRMDAREQRRLEDQAQRFFSESRALIAQVQSATSMLLG